MSVERGDIWQEIAINVTAASRKIINITRTINTIEITNTIKTIRDKDVTTKARIEETIVKKEDTTLINI